MSRQIYAAYGSNHSRRQMRSRCPGARPIGQGMLGDYRLVFAGPLTIEAHEGSVVPISLWSVTADDVERLDRYEGHPRMYRRVPILTQFGRGFCYVMNRPYAESAPWETYYDGVAAGFADWGFDLVHLEEALERSLEAEARAAKAAGFFEVDEDSVDASTLARYERIMAEMDEDDEEATA